MVPLKKIADKQKTNQPTKHPDGFRVVHSRNPRMREVEAERPAIQNYPELVLAIQGQSVLHKILLGEGATSYQRNPNKKKVNCL